MYLLTRLLIRLISDVQFLLDNIRILEGVPEPSDDLLQFVSNLKVIWTNKFIVDKWSYNFFAPFSPLLSTTSFRLLVEYDSALINLSFCFEKWFWSRKTLWAQSDNPTTQEKSANLIFIKNWRCQRKLLKFKNFWKQLESLVGTPPAYMKLSLRQPESSDIVTVDLNDDDKTLNDYNPSDGQVLKLLVFFSFWIQTSEHIKLTSLLFFFSLRFSMLKILIPIRLLLNFKILLKWVLLSFFSELCFLIFTLWMNNVHNSNHFIFRLKNFNWVRNSTRNVKKLFSNGRNNKSKATQTPTQQRLLFLSQYHLLVGIWIRWSNSWNCYWTENVLIGRK